MSAACRIPHVCLVATLLAPLTMGLAEASPAGRALTSYDRARTQEAPEWVHDTQQCWRIGP